MSGEGPNNDGGFIELSDEEAAKFPKENDIYRGSDQYGSFAFDVDQDGRIRHIGADGVMSHDYHSPRWERFRRDHPEDAKRLMDISKKRGK